MADENGLRQCPYCKEEIKSDAIKCKHCGSHIEAMRPPHGGICPYCKESINPEAIRCKHCHSMLGGISHEMAAGGSHDGGGWHHGGCHHGCSCAECGHKHGHHGHAAMGQSGMGHAGPPPVQHALARINSDLRIGRGPGLTDCYAVCSGSTLWCICTVRGTNWISMYPCGTCIDDGHVLS